MADLILGPLIGGLSAERAHLWERADGPGLLNAWLGRSPDLSDAVLAGTSLLLEKHDGFTGVVPLTGLQPDTTYYYALTLNVETQDFASLQTLIFRSLELGGGVQTQDLETQNPHPCPSPEGRGENPFLFVQFV